jgi:Ribbon-helix-helix protein, copG family
LTHILKMMYINLTSGMGDIMRPKLNVKRTNIYLTENQAKQFRKFSKEKGITASELIRRVLDQWLEKQSKK